MEYENDYERAEGKVLLSTAKAKILNIKRVNKIIGFDIDAMETMIEKFPHLSEIENNL